MGFEQGPGGADKQERLRSFDMMASVDMLRYDITMFGHVLPETRQRVHDEEMSLMAEGVDRAMRTPFALQRQDGMLVYHDKGRTRPYIGMLLTGVEAAKAEAADDYRRQFLYEMAVQDLQRGYQMNALKPGERMTWTSPYRQDIEDKFGADFMTKRGFFPKRKAGFIYQAACNEDGSVTIESQMVDNSDSEAFMRVEEIAQHDPEADMDMLLSVYDSELMMKYGGRFYAGSRKAHEGENAWEELLRNQDLVQYYLRELETIAWSTEPRINIERRTKELTIGVWKAFKKRLEAKVATQSVRTPLRPVYDAVSGVSAIQSAVLQREIRQGFEEALANNEVKPGCGGSLAARGDNPLDNIDGFATFKSIFGEKKLSGGGDDENDTYGSRTFKCQNGHTNKRPKNKLIEKCTHCGIDVRCHDEPKGGHAKVAEKLGVALKPLFGPAQDMPAKRHEKSKQSRKEYALAA